MPHVIDLFVFLKKIPSAFWGVSVGSFFSLGGVIISNRANDRRLRRQLEHDRALRNRELELSLRKDVYLAAAEAISAGINSLSRFANLGIPDDSVADDYVTKSPAIAKAYVIAKDDALVAILRLSDALEGAFFRLFAKRAPLIVQKAQIEDLGTHISKSFSENNHWLELMKQHNLSGENDPRKWSVIQENFKFEQQRQANLMERRDALASDLNAKGFALMRDCLLEIGTLRRLVSPALAAIRIELDLPMNGDVFSAITEESITIQEKQMTEFIATLQPILDVPAKDSST